MAIFFQPGKRFSNELRVKRRKGAAYRRMMRKRKRQKPLPGTKTLLSGKNDKKSGKLLYPGKRMRDFQAGDARVPRDERVDRGFDRAAMVLSGLTLLVFFAAPLLGLSAGWYGFGVLLFLLLHITVIAGLCHDRDCKMKLWISLFVFYGGMFLWAIVFATGLPAFT